jgi:hypothetical protein
MVQPCPRWCLAPVWVGLEVAIMFAFSYLSEIVGHFMRYTEAALSPITSAVSSREVATVRFADRDASRLPRSHRPTHVDDSGRLPTEVNDSPAAEGPIEKGLG